MKKSMKKLVSVALAATMVLGLAGCNDGSSQTAATTAPAAEAAGTEAAGAESGADGAQDKAEAANAGLNANILFATHEVGTSNYNLSAELAKMESEQWTFSQSPLAEWALLTCSSRARQMSPLSTALLQNGHLKRAPSANLL